MPFAPGLVAALLTTDRAGTVTETVTRIRIPERPKNRGFEGLFRGSIRVAQVGKPDFGRGDGRQAGGGGRAQPFSFAFRTEFHIARPRAMIPGLGDHGCDAEGLWRRVRSAGNVDSTRLFAIVAGIYDSINRIRALAQGLVGLQPDIIVAATAAPTVALQRETRTIPIVFVNVGDPVASGIVPRLNPPGGNITGFGNQEASLGGKWLELLSEIAPGLKRAAIMFNPDTSPVSYMTSLETAGRSLKVAPIIAPVQSELDIFRRAASYVGRILRGAKPSELPVQLPTKFEMVVNRKTATALGLAIPHR
jgi:hypothetical protein